MCTHEQGQVYPGGGKIGMCEECGTLVTRVVLLVPLSLDRVMTVAA